MRRQRYGHTLSGSAQAIRFEELEEPFNHESFTTVNDQLTPWLPYSYEEEYTHQQRNSHLFNVDQPRIASVFDNFNVDQPNRYLDFLTDIYNIYGHLNQSNYDPCSGAIGDVPDQAAHRYLSSLHVNQYRNNNPVDGFSSSSNLPSLSHDSAIRPSVSTYGTVFLVLRNLVRIDITPEKSVYVTNHPANCIGVLNSAGDQSCIVHPNGKILQFPSVINMETRDKFAKIFKKGVVFTSVDHVLAFLVDASGTKTTAEKFQNWNPDYSFEMFYTAKGDCDKRSKSNCFSLLSNSTHRKYNNGDEVWNIGGIKIKQDLWGEVRVTTNFGRRTLRTSPTIQFMSICMPSVSIKVSCDPIMHIHVKNDNKIVAAGANGMTVKNGTQRAGLDRFNRLVIY